VSSLAPRIAPCEVDRVRVDASDEWEAFVRNHPAASAYHQWNWRHIFEDVAGHPCEYLAARRGGEIVGVLPLVRFRSLLFGRALVSLPFVNYGGVVANDTEAAGALVEAACDLAAVDRARHVELRHVHRRFAQLPCRQHKVAMRLPLPATADEMWALLDRKVRNQVRKAERSGLTSVEGGAELVPEFYEVFARNMRDLGTPVYARGLFEHVLRQFSTSARVFVVKTESRAIAAGITYRFRDAVEAPWASSLREYRTLCPNTLLYWRMCSASIAQGCQEFDFGRSTPGEGTYQFKKQWGAAPTPLSWEYAALQGRPVPNQSPSNPKFALAIAAWKRLPVAVATRLGPHVVRNIP
jgi:serine/alanine adding enzyme